MTTFSRIGPRLIFCGFVCGLFLAGWASRASIAQNPPQDPPPVLPAPRDQDPKATPPQPPPELLKADAPTLLPGPIPADASSAPAAISDGPLPANNAAAPAPVIVGPDHVPIETDDPEKVANDFLVQNQKLAESQVKALKQEAEKLATKLKKIEAGIKRWERLVEALKQTDNPAPPVAPANRKDEAPPQDPPARKPAPEDDAPKSALRLLNDSTKTLDYFLQPSESTIEPPAGSSLLEGKKVVILGIAGSAPVAGIPCLEQEVPRMLAEILRKKVKEIAIVQPEKVAAWVEAHPRSSEPADAARDFGADFAIHLEVEQFQSLSPDDPNMLQGASKVHIQVFELDYPKNEQDRPIKDQPKEARNVYESYAESSFPHRGPLPIDTATSQNAFKRVFLDVAVKELSWHFVAHPDADSY